MRWAYFYSPVGKRYREQRGTRNPYWSRSVQTGSSAQEHENRLLRKKLCMSKGGIELAEWIALVDKIVQKKDESSNSFFW